MNTISSSEIRKTVYQYVVLCTWFVVHMNDKDSTDKQLDTVLTKIGECEDRLTEYGASEFAINKIVDMVAKLSIKNIGELKPGELAIVQKVSL